MVEENTGQSEIKFWLDEYDDVFSDFDPRPYSEREISDDFLKEARKVLRETTKGTFEIRFLIPLLKQNKEKDAMVQKRLIRHFRSQAEIERKTIKASKERGIKICLLGFSLLISASVINYFYNSSFFFTMIATILEPAGWFSAWSGLDNIFIKPQEMQPALRFAEKMAKATIVFEPY